MATDPSLAPGGAGILSDAARDDFLSTFFSKMLKVSRSSSEALHGPDLVPARRQEGEEVRDLEEGPEAPALVGKRNPRRFCQGGQIWDCVSIPTWRL